MGEIATEPKRKLLWLQYSLVALLFTVTAVAAWLAICSSLSRTVVMVRPACSEDSTDETYSFIDDDAEIRNIAVAKGVFSRKTCLSASLIAVQEGQTQELNRFTVGRSPLRFGEPRWHTLTITLALGSRNTPKGRVAQLGSVGFSRGSGRARECYVSFPTDFSDTYTGSISQARERIIYAEGDRKIDMNPRMTVAEFAQKNAGNYLVVTAQVE